MSFDRSKQPLPAQELSFSLPQIQPFALSNGLKVLFVQREFLPLIRMNLISNCGSVFDPLNKNGLANLFSRMIDEGAGDYNSLELNEEFEILGSSFSSSCNHDNIILSVRTLSENFERSLELLSTIILQPHFHEQDFQREKRKVEVMLLQQKDEPEELASLAFSSLVHSNSPYQFPTLGYEETVGVLNAEEIKNFYSDKFSPGNSHLIVVGNITREMLVDLLEEFLSGWQTPSTYSLKASSPVRKKKTVSILHKEGAVQTEIRIGHLSSQRNDPFYFPKTIMNLTLGGQFISRINLNLREKKGFTYGATSAFSYYKNAGEFCVSTSVSTENTLPAVNEILFELTNIKKGVTASEIDFAKSSMVRKFPSQFESDYQIASNLSLLAIHDLPINYFDTFLNNIKSVSTESINKAALDYIDMEQLSIVLVGDKNKLLEQFSVNEFGEVNVINEKSEEISN